MPKVGLGQTVHQNEIAKISHGVKDLSTTMIYTQRAQQAGHWREKSLGLKVRDCERAKTSCAAGTDSRLLSGPYGHTGGALEFAPADPCAFDRAQDRFPDTVTEHG